ncbi:MAG: TerC family protein [Desulforhopalus sp.]|nr:TerC family protein [Desulforhopalus sp.]
MLELLLTPHFYLSLFTVTLIQIALGADNLIIITILAGKLPQGQRAKAITAGLLLAMVFRIILLFMVSWILKYATSVFFEINWHFENILTVHGAFNGKSVVLFLGGLILIWKGVKELRYKAKGADHSEVPSGASFWQVLTIIVGMNILFSVDSILTVVGMTDIFLVMAGSVILSVIVMLRFAATISDYMTKNPDFEILGLFVLLLIGFVLFLEGGHVAHLTLNDSAFPYIPQWIVIFILMLMFSVDLYQNFLEKRRGRETKPVQLNRRETVLRVKQD